MKRITWNHIIMYKMLVLDKNTLNYTTVCKLLVLNWNTWYYVKKQMKQHKNVNINITYVIH